MECVGPGADEVVDATPERCTSAQIGPAPNETGHWSATRLSAPAGCPFVVTAIEHDVFGLPPGAVDAGCDPGLAHDVMVFKASSDTPPESPAVLETWTVPTGPYVDDIVTFTHALAAPITLEAGEELFVAVQMTADPVTGALCVASCSDAEAEDDRYYWSNGTDAPFPWATLKSFGLDHAYRMRAVGHAP